MAYDAPTPTQKAALNTSPTATESGIRQSDTGPAADEEGNVYALSGNGEFDPKRQDYGDTIHKLALAGGQLRVRDYVTPRDQELLSKKDPDWAPVARYCLPTKPVRVVIWQTSW